MKKSSFVALVLGVMGGLLFALGACMCMIEEWNLFTPGVVMGAAGLVVGLADLLIWRKMTGKPPIHITAKGLGAVALTIFGMLALGGGMCLIMVFEQMVPGILLGIVGIVLLLMLIPLIKGLH